MKAFYPIFRWLIMGPLFAAALMQQYCWWTTDCVNSRNWFISIVWFVIFVSSSIILAYTIFPKQNLTARHKFKCVFHTLNRGTYTRVCTRTYKSIWLFCFRQVIEDPGFFTLKQLDK